MRQRLQRNTGRRLFLIWAGVVLVTIKSIFTDFGVDNGYAIATSYRHISGDRMFLEMWEPHQTSAFLTDLLMLLYRHFVPSLTGVAVYLQVMGILLWIPVTVLLYKELSRHFDRYVSHLICAFLFVFRAKQTVFPEFSNMQIGFSILFFTFLVKYYFDQTKVGNLLLSAVFLCLEIISYPTCLIAFAAAAGFLLLYTDRKVRNVLVFGGMCLALGTLYTGYFIWARGFSEFVSVLRLLAEADLSHGDVSMSVYQYWHVFAEGAAYLAATLAIAAVIRFAFRERRKASYLGIEGGIAILGCGAT